MTSTLEYRSEPNASILLHELRTAESQMLSIRAGLEHIAENAEHRIIYLVDYPEINAFWQSKLPNHVHQLGDDGVRTIWNYLTGLEQVMSLLDYKLDEALTLLQRSYFEQAEYLESLLLNQRFFTLIAPPAWRQLEDDLIYLNRFQGDTAGNWQSAINQNEQKLLHDYSSPNEVTEHGYWGDVENFGFASLSRDKTSNLAKIVGSFVTRANFQDAEDDCWAQVSDDAQVAKHIASEIADFRPDEPHEKWTELLDEGNKLYNIAFGRSGNWRRRQDGAATLAYLYHINKVLARHAPHIKVAFVTRNHQYHHLMQAWDKQDSAADQRPLIFHPHSLIAFMIRQSGDVDFEVRSASAINIIKSIDDLLGTFRIVRQFVQEIAGSPGVGVSLPLRNYVVKRLGSGLAEFRKSSLAERVQPRIIDRKPMWSKGPNKRIAALLNKVADFRLKTTQWHRELSLLRTLPPVVELGSDVKLIYIELKERERGTAVLGCILINSRQISCRMIQSLKQEIEHGTWAI